MRPHAKLHIQSVDNIVILMTIVIAFASGLFSMIVLQLTNTKKSTE